VNEIDFLTWQPHLLQTLP